MLRELKLMLLGLRLQHWIDASRSWLPKMQSFSFVFLDNTELYQRDERLNLSSCSCLTYSYMLDWKVNKELEFEAEAMLPKAEDSL